MTGAETSAAAAAPELKQFSTFVTVSFAKNVEVTVTATDRVAAREALENALLWVQAENINAEGIEITGVGKLEWEADFIGDLEEILAVGA